MAVSQSWRSELYPEHWQRPGETVSFSSDKLIQDFSYAGYRNGEEAIPDVTGPIFNVTTYGADATGANDSTVAIQSAINAAAAAGGGVVYLPAGTFRVSPQGTNTFALRISTSNIVLRGAGTAATFLLNGSHQMRGKSVIQISPTSTSLGTTRTLTVDLPGPTRRIPVNSTSGFTPGTIVRLQWNFTLDWVLENNQQTWWGETRPGSSTYLREVVAVNSQQGWIEIDVPTRYAMKTRDSASVRTVSGQLTQVGVESFSIGNLQHPGTGFAESDYEVAGTAAYDAHASWLIRFQHVRDSWVSSVHSRQATSNTTGCHMLSNGISLLESLRITVRNCEMRRSQYGGGGGNGYMYRVQSTNECLIENSTADFSRHGFVISHGGTSGNVFFQCEDRDTQRSTGGSPTGYTTSGSGSDNHMFFSHSNLWDQCHAHNSFYTAHHRTFSGTTPHGVSSAHALYWNTSGSGTRYANVSNPIVRSEQLHYGYVIGTRATSGTAFHASNKTGGNTAPADHLEGIGSGATLVPQSLYLDQRSRRLQPTVIYHGNGATAGAAPVDATSPYEPGESVTVLGAGGLVRTGFIFTGWNTAPDGSGTNPAIGSTFEITGSTHLYAQWLGQPYTVTFDANNGTPVNPADKLVEYGTPYGTLPTTSRPGYSFVGWFTALAGGNPVTSSTSVSLAEDHTLYARWSAPPLVDAGPDQTVWIREQAPWTPDQMTTTAWYDAADASSIHSGSGAVTRWNDKSGNDHHVSQGDTTRQPTTGTRAVNGLNVLDFTEDYLFSDGGLGANIHSVFMVTSNDVAITSSSSAMILLSTAGGGISTGDGYGASTGAFVGEVLSVFDENTTGFSKRQAASSLELPTINAGAHLFTYALAKDWFIGLDGSDDLRDLSSGAARNPMLFADSFSIGAGARNHPNTVEFFYDGSVAEVILLDTTVSPEERQTLEGYLSHKWGLVANLPANHPYKVASPAALSAVATLAGSASDPENDPLTHTWSVVSGPGPVRFANATMLNTNATFTVEGEYTLRLTSHDGLASSFHEVEIIVGQETEYLVSFDANGGSPPAPAELQVVSGQTYGNLPVTSRQGFSFAGWFTARTGGTLVTDVSPVSITANHTLFARWTVILTASATAWHFIRGEAEDSTSTPLGYFTAAGEIIGVSGPGGSREQRNVVCGFTLPNLPVGGSLETASFQFEITAARDSTGGENLPGLHAYLLDTADPSGSGTGFYYHGPLDPSNDAIPVGTTSVTIAGTGDVNFPSGQEARVFTLTGDALALLKSYYNGHTPTRNTAYFRFNLGVDPAINQYRRYRVSTAAGRSSLQLGSTAPATPTIQDWPTAASIQVGQPLSAATLIGGSASVPGTFAYNDPAIFPANGAYLAAVTFIPSDVASYQPVGGTVSVNVLLKFEHWLTGGQGFVSDLTDAFTGDTNGDELADGLAWLLGAALPEESARNRLPSATVDQGALIATFSMLNDANRGNAALKLHYSTNLLSWTAVLVPETSGTNQLTGLFFEITPKGDLNDVKATLPASAGDARGKIFLRLSGEWATP